METTLLRVEGMTCAHCVKAVTDALNALSGVTGATLDLAKQSAEVRHDPGVCPVNRIIQAVEEEGYTAAIK